MDVQKVKYVIWAADAERALHFYRDVFGGLITVMTPYWNEVEVAGATIGVHPGGEGKRTWTGLSFQVADVLAAAEEVAKGGGQLLKQPEPEDGFVHLAMCADPEGNEFMLTARRPKQ